jgi:hypothetical protein
MLYLTNPPVRYFLPYQLLEASPVHKPLALAIFLTVTSAAAAQEAPMPMQRLLDGGFRIATTIAGRLIVQKDSQVFSCGYDSSAPERPVGGDLIRTSYLCVPLR